MFLSNISPSDVLVVILAFVRILALFLTLPKLATDRYFFLYRIFFSVVLTLVISPLIASGQEPNFNLSPIELTSLLIGEIGIGVCLGLASSCVIIGLVIAGQIVSQLLGFQIGSLQQGLSAEQNSDYRKLFFVVGLFSWFAVSGHRFAMEGVVQSFEAFPAGSFHFSQELLVLINQLIQTSLEFAIRFSLPVLVVSAIGFLVAGIFFRVLGTGQATSTAFGLNQILFFVISVPLVLAFSEETYRHTTGQVELLIDTFINLKLQ